MEAMYFTRVSMLNSTAKANVPCFTPRSFSQKANSQVCSTSFSKHSQRNHAIKVTKSENLGDEAASYVVDTVKEANEKLNEDFTALKDGTYDLVGKATESAGKLQDDIQANANDIAGKTSELANEVKDKVTDVLSDLDKKAKQNNQDLKKNIEDAATFVGDKAEEGKSEVAKIAEAVVDKTNEGVVGVLDATEGTTKKIKDAIADLKQ